jgi:hypothetical protein
VKLPGSGEGGIWTKEDDELPRQVREMLRGQRESHIDLKNSNLIERLRKQRLEPAEPHLLGVEHLIVLPAGWMAGIPVEVLTDDYVISYALSGTMYAWLKEKEETRRSQESDEPISLLALGDPVYQASDQPDTVLPAPPDHGVMLTMVAEGSNTYRGGLQAGDVLLSYRGETMTGPEELGPAIQAGTAAGDTVIPVSVWREGETVELSVGPGQLGVRPSEQPVREAVALRRRLDQVLETTRGETLMPLPGSRLEVEAIAELCTEEAPPTILLGSDASERRLDALASSGELDRYRYIHLATHAVMDDEVAMRSALILSQEEEDVAFERALAGEEVYDGRLTAEQIVRTWKIDADLVILSGCETALGKEPGGEGFLGFSQALFVAGARSLILSLWKVEDTATMLLMRRFYENILGRFGETREVGNQAYGPGEALPKAAALWEVKRWLRGMSSEEAEVLLGEIPGARERGIVLPKPSGEETVPERPYADPRYWAAFVLIGDPD